ncbi:hypothetical protein NE237_007670 [Protea cynaroides]|uniref:Uncharacterized protein n=1 Tax=Protea cynaroides TaxID=273540 RepID=A0A9Q0KQP4_9MAGN|nr:hypothetical protein NE237_007670 [Protea cynaroides]
MMNSSSFLVKKELKSRDPILRATRRESRWKEEGLDAITRAVAANYGEEEEFRDTLPASFTEIFDPLSSSCESFVPIPCIFDTPHFYPRQSIFLYTGANFSIFCNIVVSIPSFEGQKRREDEIVSSVA